MLLNGVFTITLANPSPTSNSKLVLGVIGTMVLCYYALSQLIETKTLYIICILAIALDQTIQIYGFSKQSPYVEVGAQALFILGQIDTF